ncbi:hypothetical protein CKO28_04915 [Rhodovibrio sodomensis]|uniref:Permease n=1 Tax=Rhodovibrio sodomensis TaxID=1088 RepID=A0ABS1DD86_9PROT|nr:hypothetical protein [Rhodovibrio sodomensis]MBK1667370.1 hypothetical protein [Rhodovibrio sodomensis]
MISDFEIVMRARDIAVDSPSTWITFTLLAGLLALVGWKVVPLLDEQVRQIHNALRPRHYIKAAAVRRQETQRRNAQLLAPAALGAMLGLLHIADPIAVSMHLSKELVRDFGALTWAGWAVLALMAPIAVNLFLVYRHAVKLFGPVLGTLVAPAHLIVAMASVAAGMLGAPVVLIGLVVCKRGLYLLAPVLVFGALYKDLRRTARRLAPAAA